MLSFCFINGVGQTLVSCCEVVKHTWAKRPGFGDCLSTHLPAVRPWVGGLTSLPGSDEDCSEARAPRVGGVRVTSQGVGTVAGQPSFIRLMALLTQDSAQGRWNTDWLVLAVSMVLTLTVKSCIKPQYARELEAALR